MKLVTPLARSLQADMQVELRNIERAVSSGTREAGRGLKTELRRQVASAGLGQRLANSWRDKHYPNRKLDAASPVYTKAPQIIQPRTRQGGKRRQADQLAHVPGASVRTAPVRASIQRTVAPRRGCL
jgi:hypothetical protein